MALSHKLSAGKKSVLMIILFSLVASAIVAIQPIKAISRTIVVPDDYSKIGVAIANAADGDTIFVKKGTYNEVLVIDKALSLRGEDKETTVINGNKTATVVLIRHDNVEVTGFTVIYDSTPNTPQPVWMWSTRLAGIHILSARYCKVTDNNVLDCGCGIWLYDALQNVVTDNYIARNDYGLRVEASINNTITRNTITGNWGGLWLLFASGNKLRDNAMLNNVRNFGTSSDQPVRDINDVDASNTVDGKPIYYWVGVSNRAVPPDAGCVVLVNCAGVTVQGLSLTKNLDGIILADCRNSVVANNVITGTGGGISVYSSFDDNIIGNTINSDTGITANGTGTKVLGNAITASAAGVGANGYYQTVADNTIEITQWQGFMIKCSGSYANITRNRLNGTSYTYASIEGSDNIFYQNVMTNCYQLQVNSNGSIIAKNDVTGITVGDGTGNVVCANRITNGLGLGIGGHNNVYYANHIENNYYVGAAVIGSEVHSSNNVLYHNNFINNKEQVKNIGANPTNLWDDGREGNYWSDYTGVDANGDGIGDTPYLVKSETFDFSLGKMAEKVNGKDNYPLMAPFDISTVTAELPNWTYNSSSPPLPSSSPEPTPSISPLPTPPSEETIAPTPSPEPQQTDPFPTSTVAASAASAAVVGTGLLIYFKKRNNPPKLFP